MSNHYFGPRGKVHIFSKNHSKSNFHAVNSTKVSSVQVVCGKVVKKPSGRSARQIYKSPRDFSTCEVCNI